MSEAQQLDLFGGARVLLMMPQTYMNLSGEAVGEAARFYKIPSDHVLVIYDDVSLPLGKLRIRDKGSAGGHNGIRSIDKSLGTNAYARVRIGVGHAHRGPHAHENTVDWVLGGFASQQRAQLPDVLADAADACETVIVDGLSLAQERFNGR